MQSRLERNLLTNCTQDQENGKSCTDSLGISEMGNCVLCGTKSVCKCERCGDFYCSPKCQRKDWPSHRFICFPMPRLVKAGSSTCSEEAVPKLKANALSIDITKEEKRQAYQARQLSYIPSTAPLPKDGDTIVVTAFKSSNRCFIRSANTTEEYNKILNKIDHFGQNSGVVNVLPKGNTYAVALKSNKWCRVQILSVRSENNVRIYFIDYGDINETCFRELRKISGAISGLPCYVNMVQLHGITTYSMKSKVLQQLSDYTNKEFKMRIVDPDDKGGNIQLFTMETNNLINSKIIQICQDCSENLSGSNTSTNSHGNDDSENEMCSSKEKDSDESLPSGTGKSKTIHTSQNSAAARLNNKKPSPTTKSIDKPCMIPPFETVEFDNIGKNFNVIVVDSSFVHRGFLGCIMESDWNNFKEIIRFLQNFNDNGQPYKPRLDEYCIAQFESEWYRAKVIEVSDDDEFTVLYIDFTNESKLSSACIRPYPLSCTLPCTTNICAIAGLPEELSAKLFIYLEKRLATFQRITVDRIKVLEGCVLLECKEFLNELRKLNLLE